MAKRLAKVLDLPFVDTDKMVTADHGSIKNIFALKGEAYFRDLESAALVKALEGQNVVATGGGIVLSMANRVAAHKECDDLLGHQHGICTSIA